MDAITENIQGDIPWCMFVADDVVLVLLSNLRLGVRQMQTHTFAKSLLKIEEPKLSISKLIKQPTLCSCQVHSHK
jgi:predicted Zn-dependent protease